VRTATLCLLGLLALVPTAAQGSAAQLRDCGGYASSDAVEVQRSKNRCFAEAFRKGARATLAVSSVDRNGRIVTESLLRVVGTRRLELFVDVKKDRLGAQRWHRFVCRELVIRARFLAPRRCLETPLTATGFWTGPRLLDCGRYARRFEPPSTDEQEGRQCLVRAFEQGAPAMLVVTGLTLDSGPMTTYYSVLAPGLAERLMDATGERFYPRQWYRQLCSRLTIDSRGFLDFQDCRFTVRPAWFPRR
jgi:hypothetical protein